MNVSTGKVMTPASKQDQWTLQFEYWMVNGGLAVAARKMKAKGVPCAMVIGWLRVRGEWCNIADVCIREAMWL